MAEQRNHGLRVLTDRELDLIRTVCDRHHKLCHFYKAPWDTAIDQIIDELTTGKLEISSAEISPGDDAD